MFCLTGSFVCVLYYLSSNFNGWFVIRGVEAKANYRGSTIFCRFRNARVGLSMSFCYVFGKVSKLNGYEEVGGCGVGFLAFLFRLERRFGGVLTGGFRVIKWAVRYHVDNYLVCYRLENIRANCTHDSYSSHVRYGEAYVYGTVRGFHVLARFLGYGPIVFLVRRGSYFLPIFCIGFVFCAVFFGLRGY